MEFTNDIRFGRKPMNNKILKLTYSGTLFKNNSSEVYIVYGFGENWEKTSEQKMEKLARGFRANIIMENYNTFNFCFRNSQNEWDNNNSFNYIAPIATQTYNSTINTLSSKEAETICKDVVSDVINTIDLDLDNANETKSIEVSDNASILDALVQELFEEYNKTSEPTVQTSSYNKENTSQSNQISNVEINKQTTESNSTSIEKGTTKNTEINTIIKESNTELDSILNDIIAQYTKEQAEIEKTETSVQSENEKENTISSKQDYEDIDIGKALNSLFEETFSGNLFSIPEIEDSEDLIPQASQYDIFEESNKINPQNINTKTETKNVETTISYDNTTENKTEENSSKQNSIIENDMFNFENLDFDFAMNSTPTINFVNNFSDSFYDDEDISIHNSVFNIQEIVNETVKNLDQEVANATNINTEEDLNKREEFDKAVSEFAEYFDNLIEEIVSTPSTSLSSSVTNEQVFESEKTELAVSQSQDIAVAQAVNTSDTNESSDGVPKEYALYDYKSHSFFYMLKRRCKLLFSTLFTKLPKVFGRENDTNNN